MVTGTLHKPKTVPGLECGRIYSSSTLIMQA